MASNHFIGGETTREGETLDQNPLGQYKQYASQLIDLGAVLLQNWEKYHQLTRDPSGAENSRNPLEIGDTSLHCIAHETRSLLGYYDVDGAEETYQKTQTLGATFNPRTNTNEMYDIIATRRQEITRCVATGRLLHSQPPAHTLHFQTPSWSIETSQGALFQEDKDPAPLPAIDLNLLRKSLEVLACIRKIMDKEANHRNSVIQSHTFQAQFIAAFQPFLTMFFGAHHTSTEAKQR